MTYKEFLDLAKKPSGKSFKGVPGPLDFGDSDDMLKTVADYTVMDDFMSNEGMDDFVEEFPTKFPQYALLAIIDYGACLKKNPNYAFDSYTEYFLCVDTSDDKNPVLLWTGEGNFEKLAGSFEDFYASLVEE
jgi:hypothetical protein